jgi:hypothetical protein
MQNVNSFTEMFGNNDFTNNSIANNCDDNIRTVDSRLDTFQDTERNSTKSSETCEPESDINVNIFRYKFAEEFTRELFVFSKIHQYDPRKEFKEAWKIWLEENECIVDEEIRRLKNLGYDGDILDKMFKSARYYFRKKGTEKKAPSQRRDYIGVQKNLLETMDKHIRIGISTEDYKPSDGFDDFCKKNIDILKEEVSNLCKNGFTDSNQIKNKIKKTYKNRYFLFISK